MKYRATAPHFTEISASRQLAPSDAPEGKMTTEIKSTLGLTSDRMLIDIKLQVILQGVSNKDDAKAFEVSCEVFCQYQFDEPVQEEKLDDDGFNRLLYEPLYQRAAAQAQELAWQLGYGSIRAPILMPTTKEEAPGVAKPASKASAARAKPRKRPVT